MEANISLTELLQNLHDPRGNRGKRHPLPALLALAIVGMLAGMTSDQAIVEYGKERGWEFLKLLGFTRRRGLCKATYSRVFRRIDVLEFEQLVGQWIQARLGPDDARLLNLDGKTARGSRVAMARRLGFTCCRPSPRTSRRSWASCGSMPRPMSTRPPWNSWGCCRCRARSSPATPCSRIVMSVQK